MMAPEVLVLKTELAMVEARYARLELEIAEIKALQAQSAAQIALLLSMLPSAGSPSGFPASAEGK